MMKRYRLQGQTSRYVSILDLRPHEILEPSLWRQATGITTLPSQVDMTVLWCPGVVVQSDEVLGINDMLQQILC